MKFHSYVKDGDLGYVVGFNEYGAKRFAVYCGGDARVSQLCSMVQTSDNSPIVVNVPRRLFLNLYPQS